MSVRWLSMVAIAMLAVVAYAGKPLPPPYRKPLPPPHPSVQIEIESEIEEVPYDPDAEVFETEGVEVIIREMAPDGRPVRLDGPTRSWPGCGARWCMMCLGSHLRSSSHGMSYQHLNSVGSGQWITVHDNIHNSEPAERDHPSTGATTRRTPQPRRTWFPRLRRRYR